MLRVWLRPCISSIAGVSRRSTSTHIKEIVNARLPNSSLANQRKLQSIKPVGNCNSRLFSSEKDSGDTENDKQQNTNKLEEIEGQDEENVDIPAISLEEFAGVLSNEEIAELEELVRTPIDELESDDDDEIDGEVIRIPKKSKDLSASDWVESFERGVANWDSTQHNFDEEVNEDDEEEEYEEVDIHQIDKRLLEEIEVIKNLKKQLMVDDSLEDDMENDIDEHADYAFDDEDDNVHSNQHDAGLVRFSSALNMIASDTVSVDELSDDEEDVEGSDQEYSEEDFEYVDEGNDFDGDEDDEDDEDSNGIPRSAFDGWEEGMAVTPEHLNWMLPHEDREPFKPPTEKPWKYFVKANHQDIVELALDVDLLRLFISPTGRIYPRRFTGLTAKQQRQLARAVKTSRRMALLPYLSRYPPPSPQQWEVIMDEEESKMEAEIRAGIISSFDEMEDNTYDTVEHYDDSADFEEDYEDDRM